MSGQTVEGRAWVPPQDVRTGPAPSAAHTLRAVNVSWSPSLCLSCSVLDSQKPSGTWCLRGLWCLAGTKELMLGRSRELQRGLEQG